MNYKQGDVDFVTGLVYYGRQASCKNGLRWMTREKFDAKIAGVRAYKKTQRYRERMKVLRNTDEGRAKRNAYTKQRRAEDGDRIREHCRQYARKRRAENHIATMAGRISARINEVFRGRNFPKKSKVTEMLGCSFEELAKHLEDLFCEGMSWSNRSKWHIDHIIPLASAKTEEEVARLFHYTNLRPLWARENQSKSGKVVRISLPVATMHITRQKLVRVDDPDPDTLDMGKD